MTIKNNYFCHVDQDGVLADCERQMAKYSGISLESLLATTDDERHKLWENLMAKVDMKKFFAEMEPESNAGKLVGWLNSNNINWGILSRPVKAPKTADSIAGKKIWLAKQNITVPAIFEKNKSKYAKDPEGNKSILIDDLAENINGFQAAGGVGLLYKNAECDKTLRKLETLYFGEQLSEVTINNYNGIGAVPNNTNVDYLGLRVMMKPSVFLKLAAGLISPSPESMARIKDHLNNGQPMGAPFLEIKIPRPWEDGNLESSAKVVGHEGRHRMKAIVDLYGDEPVEVHLFFREGIRNRHLTPEWIERLNKSLLSQGEPSYTVKGPLFAINS
jgi:hypothetical protein